MSKPSNILFVPVKSYSERVPRKNFLLVSGKPLYRHFISNALQARCFNVVCVDTDSPEVAEWASSAGCAIIDRLPHLAANDANGNSLLRHHISLYPNYDIYWQGFVTTPKMSYPTIRDMVELMNYYWANPYPKSFDSILSGKTLRGHFWTDEGVPVNFRPDLMPRSQDLPRLFKEIHGLHGITAKAFEVSRGRVGSRPLLYNVPDEEAADIDWSEDAAKLGTTTDTDSRTSKGDTTDHKPSEGAGH